jgi:hypothetical protein
MEPINTDVLTVFVETRVLARSADTRQVTLSSPILTCRELIEAKIRAEWFDKPSAHAQPLGAESLDVPMPNGQRLGSVPESVEQAIRAGVDAFRAGWYIIIVDGRQATGLDEVLSLSSDAKISFVRLGPLP